MLAGFSPCGAWCAGPFALLMMQKDRCGATMEVFMPAQQDNGSQKPSVIDLVTDPEKFDQWQRQRERDEASSDGDRGQERGRGDDRGGEPGRGRSDSPGGRD